VHRHRTCIVRNENTALTCGELEHIGIASTFEVSLNCGDEVKRWFLAEHTRHDRPIQVDIRKKADAHGSSLLVAWRARSNLVQSPGFAWESGMEDWSMSRSLASR